MTERSHDLAGGRCNPLGYDRADGVKLAMIDKLVGQINKTVKFYHLSDPMSDGIHVIGDKLIFYSDCDVLFTASLKKEHLDRTIERLTVLRDIPKTEILQPREKDFKYIDE